MYHRRRDAICRHPIRLQPDAHRERAVTENIGALHAAHRAQFRLHDAGQIIGDLILIEICRREAEVHRRKLVVRRL